MAALHVAHDVMSIRLLHWRACAANVAPLPLVPPRLAVRGLLTAPPTPPNIRGLAIASAMARRHLRLWLPVSSRPSSRSGMPVPSFLSARRHRVARVQAPRPMPAPSVGPPQDTGHPPAWLALGWTCSMSNPTPPCVDDGMVLSRNAGLSPLEMAPMRAPSYKRWLVLVRLGEPVRNAPHHLDLQRPHLLKLMHGAARPCATQLQALRADCPCCATRASSHGKHSMLWQVLEFQLVIRLHVRLRAAKDSQVRASQTVIKWITANHDSVPLDNEAIRATGMRVMPTERGIPSLGGGSTTSKEALAASTSASVPATRPQPPDASVLPP